MILTSKGDSYVSRNVKPLHNFVLIKMLPKAGVTEGGVQVPESSDLEPEKGFVVAIGPGHWENGVFIPVSVKVGSTIYLGRYKGALGVRIKGSLHVLVPEVICVACLEEPNE